MAIGDDAIAGGMGLVNGATANSAQQIDDYINTSRDYIANGPAYWKSGVVVAIADGGTGATTASAARTALGVPATGAAVGNKSVGSNVLELQWADMGAGGPHLQQWIDGTYNGQIAKNTDIPSVSGLVSKSGDTMSGDLYIPGASAATSGWTAAYIDGSGRVCRGSSSLRYKEDVSEVPASAFGNIFHPLSRFRMRGGDGRYTYGHMAEQLAADPDTEQFVMYDGEGRPDSIDYIPLLLAKVEVLEARLAALEGNA